MQKLITDTTISEHVAFAVSVFQQQLLAICHIQGSYAFAVLHLRQLNQLETNLKNMFRKVKEKTFNIRNMEYHT